MPDRGIAGFSSRAMTKAIGSSMGCEEANNPNVGSETLSLAEVLLTVDDTAILVGLKATVTNDVNNSAAPH